MRACENVRVATKERFNWMDNLWGTSPNGFSSFICSPTHPKYLSMQYDGLILILQIIFHAGVPSQKHNEKPPGFRLCCHNVDSLTPLPLLLPSKYIFGISHSNIHKHTSAVNNYTFYFHCFLIHVPVLHSQPQAVHYITCEDCTILVPIL